MILSAMSTIIYIFDAYFLMTSVIIFSFILIKTINNINLKVINLFNYKVTAFQLNMDLYLYKTIKTFIEQHNQFCIAIQEYNTFWSKILFSFLLFQLPINIFITHQIFFENLIFLVKIILIVLLLINMWILWINFYIFAFLSFKIHYSTNTLSRLQWRLNRWPIRIAFKIKLMAYFERLNSKKRIGVSLGPFSILTFNIFSQVFY